MLAVQRLPAGTHLGIREAETVASGRRGWRPAPLLHAASRMCPCAAALVDLYKVRQGCPQLPNSVPIAETC